MKFGDMEFDGLTVEEATALAESFRRKGEKTAEKTAVSAARSAKKRPAKRKAKVAVAAAPAQKGSSRTPPKPAKLAAKAVPTENVRSALSFLTAVQNAGKAGLSAEGVREAFGVSHVKAIGTKASVVNKMLAEFALRQNSVYTNKRTPVGRLWKPGKNMGIALEELQKRVSAH
jgi:hypothetical protein